MRRGYRSPAAPPRPVMPGRKPAPWTEAHQREALRRTYEIAAEIAADGLPERAQYVSDGAAEWAVTELSWRAALRDCLDAARIDREVRRVRALAEGRLVRETGWRTEGMTVRVTRIRKASR